MSVNLNVLSPNQYILKVKKEFGKEIANFEKEYNLPPRSLFLQVGLHLYKFRLEELFICNHFDEKQIEQYSINRNLMYGELHFLSKYLRADLPIYQKLREASGSSCINSRLEFRQGVYCETSEVEHGVEIFFDSVASDIGGYIQKNIHYIKAARTDTECQFGLYRKNHTVPFAYVAFSLLDRHYLANIPQLKNIPLAKIYVLTRAYAFPNSPHNAMSVLYSQCFNRLRQEYGAAYVLTALNQNLCFSGSSLFAANFELVAFSPMKYYYLDGLYSTRRKVEKLGKKYLSQQFSSGPIMWFGKNLTDTKAEIDSFPITVTDEMYDQH